MYGEMEERENRRSSEKAAGEEEAEVMSEVHLGCPPYNPGPFISRFTFSLPLPEVELMGSECGEYVEEKPSSLQELVDFDEDGDLILPRRSRQSCYSACISIQHKITSTIPSVGLQVWQAELILADFVLHNMFCSSILNGVVLELGAGTGLVGMLIARVAEAVFITDHGLEVLNNCATNVHLNSGIFRSGSSVKVRELDWLNPWPPLGLEPRTRYSWTPSEVEEVSRASVLLAADVIYSDELTDAFFSILKTLMSQNSEAVLYLALEKRYNFTMDDLDVVANGYSHFCSYLTDTKSFTGKRVDLSGIPQYVREYERGSDVELWEIKYVAEKHWKPAS